MTMMTRTKLLCLLMVLVLLVTLAGCHEEPKATMPPTTAPATLPPTTAPTEPELTAESLMKQVSEALNGREPTKMLANLTIDLGIKMEMSGFSVSMDAGMELEMDAIISEDPYAMYADMSMKVDSMGQTQVQKVEAYYLTENGSLVCYAYDRALNAWTYAELGDAPESGTSEEDDSSAEVPPLDVTLDEDTQKLNRREVYVLRCVLTRDHLAQFMTPVTGSLISPLSNDTPELPEDLRADAVIYVDAQTFLPIRIQIDILGLEDMLNDLLSDSMGLPSVELSLTAGKTEEEEKDSPFAFSIDTFRIELDSLEFDPAEMPPVPQEAYDYLEMTAHEPDLGNGSYLIVHTGAAALITPPEGWTLWDVGFNWLYFEHATQPIYASYTMYSGMTRQQLQQLILSESVTPMQEAELLDSYAYGDRIGKFDTLYAKTTYGTTMYYAWAPMSDGWLLVTVQDETGSEMYGILTPLLEAVENHEPLY